MTVAQLIAELGFHRFEISHESDATLVDIAWDARLRPPQPSPYGPVLDRDELAADKVLAVFGRAAPRDFVDVFRLLEYYSRDALCALAVEKDRGFDARVFGEMLTRIGSYERQDFPVDDQTYDAMRHEFDAWQRVLRREPSPNPTSRAPDYTRAPEPPGLDLD
jgi:predicted nucleotidyltransferase component of viral defense system